MSAGAAPLTLGLPITMPGVKPAVGMNTLSKRFALMLAVIPIATVLCCCDQRRTANDNEDNKYKFNLKVGGPTKDDFADLRKGDGKDTFDAALRDLDKRQYKIRFKPDQGSIDEDYTPPPLHGSIRTDRIITSELANNRPLGESAANDPHATYRVQSSNPTDIKAVLNAFATPTPAP
jgi:hypothetical protein